VREEEGKRLEGERLDIENAINCSPKSVPFTRKDKERGGEGGERKEGIEI